MFERFTSEARHAVQSAHEEARAMAHGFIGTEHLLLGLVDSPGPARTLLAVNGLTRASLRQRIVALTAEPLDGEALATVGIDLDRVRAATERQLGAGALERRPGPIRTGHLPLTRRAKKALELSLREAVALHSKEIGSAHLLLGLLREGDGPAIALLRDSGVDPAELGAATGRLLRGQAA